MPLFDAAWELIKPGPLTLERAWKSARKAFEPDPPAVVALRRLNAQVRDSAGLVNDILPDCRIEEPRDG